MEAADGKKMVLFKDEPKKWMDNYCDQHKLPRLIAQNKGGVSITDLSKWIVKTGKHIEIKQTDSADITSTKPLEGSITSHRQHAYLNAFISPKDVEIENQYMFMKETTVKHGIIK